MPTTVPQISFNINLQSDERVKLIAYRHWLVLARNLSIWFTFWFFCTIIFLWRVSIVGIDTLNTVLFGAGTIFFFAMIYSYFDWRNDALVVTNQRVISYNSRFLISVQRNELYVREIEDVKTVTESVFSRYFDYGEIEVQTASRLRNIAFLGIVNPTLVRDTILEFVEPVKEEEQVGRVEQIVRAKVLKQGVMPSLPPLSDFIPPEQTGRTLLGIIPPSPEVRGNSIIWRKHWLFLFVEAANPILLFLILNLSWSLLIGNDFIRSGGSLLILAVLDLFCIAWLIYEVIDWRNDEYIVTPINIIDIERKPLGRETKRETTWDKIQNISLNQENLWARILKYGDVELFTAGQNENFTFRGVAAPDSVLAVISDYRDQFEQRARDRDFDSTLMLLQHYHKLQREELQVLFDDHRTHIESKLPPPEQLETGN
ncbi:PH domain-containing protein [Herpetosiphon llansteffanensis]|uniref:PH domain-containing protein n=1 Tax=Herpetosiphon llansteffanensis TaxID=2094568 RepID=UPI000D7CE93A|nr:PH domain-containing protein [Herpetosiphon llansteffanensis]